MWVSGISSILYRSKIYVRKKHFFLFENERMIKERKGKEKKRNKQEKERKEKNAVKEVHLGA